MLTSGTSLFTAKVAKYAMNVNGCEIHSQSNKPSFVSFAFFAVK
jgi:hypothetical protein